MFKISRQFLRSSTGFLSQKNLASAPASDLIISRSISTQTEFSSAMPKFGLDGKPMSRIFAPYSIFKGKAALSADPRLPTFTKVESGGYRVGRRGSIMLTFWPAIGEHRYEWGKRQSFALSPTEVGSLISLGANDSCEFFHDPSMKSSNAGQVRKSLTVRAHADGSGYFISLNVVNNVHKTNDRFTVPVTSAEFAVMRTAFAFALPHIMGWDRLTNQQLEFTARKSSSVAAVADLQSSEWDR